MPKKAHKPPNVPACENSHLPIIEVFPTAKSPRKPNPTYNFSPGTHQNFLRALWFRESSISQATVSRCFCASAETNVMIMYGTARQDCNSLLSSQDTLRRPESKLALARTFMGLHSPSALHSEKASTCSPQRPRRQHQPNSKGLCHNAYSAAHRQSTANLHVSAVRTNSLAPRHIWIHGSIYWTILENKKGSILRVTLKKEFNSQSHIGNQEGSILTVILKKSSILWVILEKEFHFLRLFFRPKVQFFESFLGRKKFKSLSHIQKKWVQFFE